MTVTRGMVTVTITAMTTPPAMRPTWTVEERATADIVKGRVLVLLYDVYYRCIILPCTGCIVCTDSTINSNK